MKSIFFLTAAIALGLVMMSGFHGSIQNNPLSADDNVSQITDGAYRDGLFQGKIAAERGDAPHIAVGRWSTVAERASFTAGYQRGYTKVLSARLTGR
jgi:hypothetical protein